LSLESNEVILFFDTFLIRNGKFSRPEELVVVSNTATAGAIGLFAPALAWQMMFRKSENKTSKFMRVIRFGGLQLPVRSLSMYPNASQ
jgi:hypothetical protein